MSGGRLPGCRSLDCSIRKRCSRCRTNDRSNIRELDDSLFDSQISQHVKEDLPPRSRPFSARCHGDGRSGSHARVFTGPTESVSNQSLNQRGGERGTGVSSLQQNILKNLQVGISRTIKTVKSVKTGFKNVRRIIGQVIVSETSESSSSSSSSSEDNSSVAKDLSLDVRIKQHSKITGTLQLY